MDQRIHIITVATPDLDAARAFYASAGWTAQFDVPGEILFYQVAPGLVLGMFDEAKYREDLGVASRGTGVGGLTLAHNVDSREAVIEVVAALRRAGGTVLQEPSDGKFGGIFHAHVEDPNGLLWEIAHNPGWTIDDQGNTIFG